MHYSPISPIDATPSVVLTRTDEYPVSALRVLFEGATPALKSRDDDMIVLPALKKAPGFP